MRASLILVISAGMALAADDGLRQAYERVVYGMENAEPGRYEGVNPAQRLALEFNSDGPRLKHPKGEAAFSLAGYGHGARLRAPLEAKPVASENRVEYRRGDLTEWYVNESRGLEQGFTLLRRTDSAGPLVIALSVAGDLRPELSAEGDAVLLRSSDGVVLRYAGLRAWDARGRTMPSKLQVRGQEIRLVVEDDGAEYPLTVDPTWTQQAELIAADGAANDIFGVSVALSGATAVIGAPGKKIGSNTQQGAAYVFVRNGGTWSLQQELLASDGAPNDYFGAAVAVSVDTIVVGAYNKLITQFFTPVPGAGVAYVFVRNGATWTLQQEINAFDAAANDNFGFSVAVNGDTAVVGAPNKMIGSNQKQGAAYVYARNGAAWTQQGEFTVSSGAANDDFGKSVGLSGTLAAVGAPGRAQSQGSTFLFVRNGATWTFDQELTAPNPAAGDSFGASVSVDGGTVAVGAPSKTIAANAKQGAAYVFTFTALLWTVQGTLLPSDGAANDGFGWSVSVSGNTAVVGAPGKTAGQNLNQGAVYVFGRSGSTWSQQQELTAFDGAAGNDFGGFVAVSGNTLIAGAPFKNGWHGAAYVLTMPTTPTTHVFNDFAGNGRSGALLYDPSMGQSYTALSNGNGTYQYVPNPFTPHFDTLRTGDYNGDGKADLILYNSQTALAYIGFGNGDGTFNFQSLFWSPAYNFVETGDIDGNGETDVALYNSATGTLYTGISNGTGTFTYEYHLVSQGFTFVRLADFTGDGKADLLLYRASDGVSFLGAGDGAGNFTFHALTLSPGYMVDVGDLNGDGKVDVILYNPINGNAATGISDGAGGFAFTPHLFSPGFTSIRLADYTGDGLADVTLYNGNSGLAYFGTGTGTGAFNFQSLFWSAGYDYDVPQDVNGDGKVDVLLYNSATGTEYTGISNGNGTFSYTYQYWGLGKVLAK